MMVLCMEMYDPSYLLLDQEGAALVGEKELGSTRAETAAVTALEKEDKPTLKRAGTMAQTAKVGGAVSLEMMALYIVVFNITGGRGVFDSPAS